MESPDLVQYYERRAGEYEAIYAKPERQRVLKNFPTEAELRSHLPALRYEALQYYWLAEYELK